MAARKTTKTVATTDNDINVRPANQLGIDSKLGVMAAKAAVASGTAARNFTGAFAIAFKGERRLAQAKRNSELDIIRARYGL